MKQQFMKTAFFDFDGVIVDTEPIYDIYWNEAGKRYQTGIPNFASHIKANWLIYSNCPMKSCISQVLR